MTAKETAKQLERIFKNPAKYGFRECTLCGREQIVMMGICIPYDGELRKKLQTPEGKTRTAIYALCRECSDRPNRKKTADEIEAQLILDIEQNPSMLDNVLKIQS